MTQRTFPSYWVYKDVAGQWRWTYHAVNGKAIAVSSEAYIRKADCLHGISLVSTSGEQKVWFPIDLVDAA
ncbi:MULTISPECIES: DUF1508 domain-containing protein [unclassified Mesorhizobium]|uniref:YegP family protein n=1 Tax=unclassified Mesorhizobium TaxID=325217 RepID=UPI000FCBB3E8|nr:MULTISPECIES: DUF1508 domain-containing protein [unclassified Mesorhizobium]RUX95820.1 DUF1508 domain-containing protein [Mesorhizobium sp. M7D.F.Ca.US.004.01.2.1]RVA31037.1 DUF1508 domain-containing protein [Mesorhizobium sp. M7D.F.Ca.US.004.03.1.1]